MAIDLSTFWGTWDVVSGNTQATNQYEFWKGMVMSTGQILNNQYEFFQYHNTTRYEWFKNLQGTYPEVWDEYTFYKNTTDPDIFDYSTFYTYGGAYLTGGGTTTTTTTAPPAWTPANLNNLWDWWASTTGVTITSGNVDSWGGYNGNTLTPFNGTLKASYSATDSDFDNEPSITFNPTADNADCGYNITVPTNTTSKTIILIGKLVTERGGDNSLMSMGEGQSPRLGIWGTNADNYLCYANGPDGDTIVNAGTTFVNGNYQIIQVTYNRSSGSVDFYAGTSTSAFSSPITTMSKTSGNNFTSGKFGVCSYGGAYGLSPTIKVVDVIFINGIPSAGEITNLSTYITNKYGI